MSNLVKIHQQKQGRRPHFLREWAEYRGKKQSDISRETGIDKSQVSRWFDEEKPSTPSAKSLDVLAGYFETEPEALFRHPDEDWLARFFADRKREEVERIKATLEAAFPKPSKRA